MVFFEARYFSILEGLLLNVLPNLCHISLMGVKHGYIGGLCFSSLLMHPLWKFHSLFFQFIGAMELLLGLCCDPN